MSKGDKKPGSRSDGYRDGSLLRYYRAVNEAQPDCVVYVLGPRGFFAEITSVARAMIYAWVNGWQLVLDSSDFAYAFRDGWSDYFLPFCRDVSEVSPERIRETFRFNKNGDRSHFARLRAFDPESLRFGTLQLVGMQTLLRHSMRLIFRPGYESQRQIDRLRQSLDLRPNYVALHIRRGDKVGDEDTSYPVELYFERLGALRKEVVFVMSDDYATVLEVSDYLESRQRSNRVVTLCQPHHAGFSVKKLQEGKNFSGGTRAIDDEAALRLYAWEETNRLLAETVIAAGAQRFVSTYRSNVGKSVWYLHEKPEECHLLGSHEARRKRAMRIATDGEPKTAEVTDRPDRPDKTCTDAFPGQLATDGMGSGSLLVSLTSIFSNQSRLLRTLESILTQSRLPDKIFVHLSTDPYLMDAGFPGRRITDAALAAFLDRHADRIHVRWVENDGPYRKLLPLLRELAERGTLTGEGPTIVTLDDDLAYHEDVIAQLVGCNAPSACLRGFDMRIESTAELSTWSYEQRQRQRKGFSLFHYSTGVGGVLLRPSVFKGLFEILLDSKLYREHCPTNDDIWFNLLRIANGVPMTIVDAPYVAQDLTNEPTSLWQNFNGRGNNDQIRATVKLLRSMGVFD